MRMEPIAVTPKVAFAAIGVGNTKGYELINSGELEAVKLGRSTRITWESVKQLIQNAPRFSAHK
jgi:excisionase family DNA binding protein